MLTPSWSKNSCPTNRVLLGNTEDAQQTHATVRAGLGHKSAMLATLQNHSGIRNCAAGLKGQALDKRWGRPVASVVLVIFPLPVAVFFGHFERTTTTFQHGTSQQSVPHQQNATDPPYLFFFGSDQDELM